MKDLHVTSRMREMIMRYKERIDACKILPLGQVEVRKR